MILLEISLTLLFIAANAEYEVKTKNGVVRGIKTKTVSNGTEYYSFRGIPYAQPPLDDLRFRDPVPVSNWPGIFDASKDGDVCVQLSASKIGQTIGSEDCLFVNVYTPKLPSNKTVLLPVMVWIHGGIYIFGTGGSSQYGPDYIMDQRIVVVTMNYRLGIFGFISTGDDSAPGNYGLKDQVLALKWAHDNVAAFGGNPNDITLTGESAGSVSVSLFAQSPKTQGLFHKAIMASGSTLCTWSLSRTSRAVAFGTGTLLGIITTSSQKLVDRLRTVSAYKLNTIASGAELAKIIVANPLRGLIFAPVIEKSSPTAIYDFKSHQNLLEGKFANIPYLIGFNSAEGNFFNQIISYLKLYLLVYDVAPTFLVPIDMNVRLFNQIPAALNIRTRYFGLLPIVLESNDKVTHLITDDQFIRPVRETVRLLTKNTKVYYYRFSYEGILGLLQLLVGSKTKRTYQGVAHAEDVSYIWIAPGEVTGSVSARDQLTRHRFVKIWTNFIKTGTPTPHNNDSLLQNIEWPITRQIGSNDGFKFLDIGNDLRILENPSQSDVDYWNNLYNRYGVPPYNTY